MHKIHKSGINIFGVWPHYVIYLFLCLMVLYDFCRRSDAANLRVNVVSRGNNDPVFTQASYTFFITEDTPVGTTFGHIRVRAPGRKQSKCIFTIISRAPDKMRKINFIRHYLRHFFHQILCLITC